MVRTLQQATQKRRLLRLKWGALGVAGAGLTLALALTPTVSVGAGNQVSSGRQIYQESCAKCHGVQMQGAGGTPRLAGSGSVVRRNHTSGQDLYDFIDRAMPFDNPGSLKDQEYWDLVAFLWNANGVDPGTMAVGPDTAAQLTWDYTPEVAPAMAPANAASGQAPPLLAMLGVGGGIVVVGVLVVLMIRKQKKPVQ